MGGSAPCTVNDALKVASGASAMHRHAPTKETNEGVSVAAVPFNTSLPIDPLSCAEMRSTEVRRRSVAD